LSTCCKSGKISSLSAATKELPADSQATNRNIYLHTFLKRKQETDHDPHPELSHWLEKFEQDRVEAASEFWYEILKGINENLREFY
jgi:hypothetical protein